MPSDRLSSPRIAVPRSKESVRCTESHPKGRVNRLFQQPASSNTTNRELHSQVLMSKQKNVFISHHHADDEHVTRLTDMLKRNGFELRNSSIRAKPSNQARLDKGLVSDETIKRLLRMKMSWASTVVVLIGKETHKRPWVDWEI